MVAPSAGAVHPYTCTATALPGGRVQYNIDQPLPKNCTERGWEDSNNTALTVGDQKMDLVHEVTDQTLTLNQCVTYTHFSAQCSDFVEAHCSLNCNSAPPLTPPLTSPPVLSAVTDEPHRVVIAVVIAVVLGVVLGVVLALVFWRKHRNKCSREAEVACPETAVPLIVIPP